MLVSILPFAAFADVDAASSRVIVSTDKADADGKDEVELDILLKGAVGETTLYVYSSRGSADTFYEEEVTADNKVGKYNEQTGVWTIPVTPDKSGWASLKVTSELSGSRNLYIGTVGEKLADYVKKNATSLEAGIIFCYEGDTAVDYATYTFEATDDYEVKFEGADAEEDEEGKVEYYYVDDDVAANGAKYLM